MSKETESSSRTTYEQLVDALLEGDVPQVSPFGPEEFCSHVKKRGISVSTVTLECWHRLGIFSPIAVIRHPFEVHRIVNKAEDRIVAYDPQPIGPAPVNSDDVCKVFDRWAWTARSNKKMRQQWDATFMSPLPASFRPWSEHVRDGVWTAEPI